ncbi:olfactory receptor 1E1-like [Alligator mississippiensis]|uniref:Olfactory receptor n=2 Tax=Alligator mississippiensis TaxID=8496 RepID=A0A151MRJ3_ALLMI|nr:olfactory receptor 1E1-like [Alligator mississippiensis]
MPSPCTFFHRDQPQNPLYAWTSAEHHVLDRAAQSMEPGNVTAAATDFVLLGLTFQPELRHFLFPLFLAVYLVTLLGNLLIVFLTRWDPALCRTPMYFLLGHLSLADVGFTTTAAPKLLGILASGSGAISYGSCLAQMYFFITFGVLENFLLTVMAYDRYVAVCHPLRYATLISPGRCWGLVGTAWGLAHFHASLHTILMSRLPFCGSRHIHHFFCDLQQLLALACGDTSTNEIAVFAEGGLAVLVPFLFVAASYGRIVVAILRLPSAQGRRKAVSTCGAHLVAVAVFYGTVIGIFFRPSSSYNPQKDMVASLLYSTITPLLNPFIYTLRNKDLHAAWRRALGQCRVSGEVLPMGRETQG